MKKEIIIIKYGRKKFKIKVIFSNRKTSVVSVYPNKHIIAKFPRFVKKDRVKGFLYKKASWINNKIDYFEQFHPLPTKRKYIRGESYYYLGKQYQLNIKKSEEECVKMKFGEIVVYTHNPYNNLRVKRLLSNWYKTHAIKYISKRIDKIMPMFDKIIIKKPKFKFRKMKSRWGSCKMYNEASKQTVITINTELIRAPLYCIDYVIIHELLHIKYRKHNNKFYEMLSYFLPDWEMRKKRLEFVHIID